MSRSRRQFGYLASDKSRLARQAAFTLFELILAIALSVALLALIGTAINLYLLRVDAGRTRVEEAQLARSVLTMIADDIRMSAIYKPQDTSAVASLVAASAAFDADSIDEDNLGSGGGGGGNSGGFSATGGNGGGTSGPSVATSGGGSAFGGSAAGGGSAGGTSAEADLTMPLGVNGTISDLYVDVERRPRVEELFRATSGYTNANPIQATPGTQTTVLPQASNIKTVRYFIRQGRPMEAASPAITSLDPAAQLQIGGLVRQEIDRPTRVLAEATGNQAVLETGQALIAPEVVHIEFRYFNGSQVGDYWDMKEMGSLPPAIEVKIWLKAAGSDDTQAVNPLDLQGLLAGAREYRQIVFLPMSQVGSAGMAGATGGSTMGSSSGMSGGSSTSGSSSGTGTSSGFAQ